MFKQYRRMKIGELRPYEAGEDMSKISITQTDKDAGSPKIGDMIGRNPKDHTDQWLVSAAYFLANYKEIEVKP